MISIIDDNGSRQFSVHHLVQKIALIAGVGTLAIVVLYFIAAHFLMSELEVILANNTQVRENFQSIYEKNSELERNIDYKTNEFLKISSKINELENIVNVHQRNHETYHHQDIDLDSLTPLQKDMILKIIPNGNPVDDFASKNFPSKSASIYTLVQGTPVYATADGVVTSANFSTGGYGYLVKIDHSLGFMTYYAHLNKIVVQKGMFVKRGQLIAYSGNTGQSTGPHLHYEIRFLGKVIDPKNFMEWKMSNFDSIFEKERSVVWQSLLATINNLMD